MLGLCLCLAALFHGTSDALGLAARGGAARPGRARRAALRMASAGDLAAGASVRIVDDGAVGRVVERRRGWWRVELADGAERSVRESQLELLSAAAAASAPAAAVAPAAAAEAAAPVSVRSLPDSAIRRQKRHWLVFSDLHASPQTLETCLSVLRSVYLEAKALDSGVLFLGDFWHVRGYLKVDVLNALMAELRRWEGVPVVMIPGNHDQVDYRGLSHALEPLQYSIGDCVVLSEPTVFMGALFLPFRRRNADYGSAVQVARQKKFKIDAVFCHADVRGAALNDLPDGRGALASRSGVAPEDLCYAEGVPVYAGHFHAPQTLGALRYVGSPYQMTAAEANQRKFLYLLDREAGWAICRAYAIDAGRRHFRLDADGDAGDRLRAAARRLAAEDRGGILRPTGGEERSGADPEEPMVDPERSEPDPDAPMADPERSEGDPGAPAADPVSEGSEGSEGSGPPHPPARLSPAEGVPPRMDEREARPGDRILLHGSDAALQSLGAPIAELRRLGVAVDLRPSLAPIGGGGGGAAPPLEEENDPSVLLDDYLRSAGDGAEGGALRAACLEALEAGALRSNGSASGASSVDLKLYDVSIRNFGPFREEQRYPLGGRGLVWVRGRVEAQAGGGNGAGKSSLFSAVLWALTGQLENRPGGESRAADVVHDAAAGARAPSGEGVSGGEGVLDSERPRAARRRGRGRPRKEEEGAFASAVVAVRGECNGRPFEVRRTKRPSSTGAGASRVEVLLAGECKSLSSKRDTDSEVLQRELGLSPKALLRYVPARDFEKEKRQRAEGISDADPIFKFCRLARAGRGPWEPRRPF